MPTPKKRIKVGESAVMTGRYGRTNSAARAGSARAGSSNSTGQKKQSRLNTWPVESYGTKIRTKEGPKKEKVEEVKSAAAKYKVKTLKKITKTSIKKLK